MLKINQKAPQFSLKCSDGSTVKLKDFADKWVVLYFYPKDNTSGCTKEAIDFSELLPQFKKLNAVVIGVSPDSSESHIKFINKQNLSIVLLSDPDKKTMKKYGAWGMKKNYGREYEGVIRSTFLISPEGKIEEIWNNVKVRVKRKDGEVKHAEIILDKIKLIGQLPD